MTDELNISTMVSMLDTNLTILPQNLAEVFNKIEPIPYFDNKEGVIKVTLRGENKGTCKKTIYQKNKWKKVIKKTFQNQLSFYIRVFEEKQIKFIQVVSPTVETDKYIYEFKKGQTAFQYNAIKITFESSVSGMNSMCMKSIVNRKSIPNTIVFNQNFTTPEKNTFEYKLDSIGFSNCLVIESSLPIKEIYLNFIVEVNMFVFTSGKVKVAGCTTDTQIQKAIKCLVDTMPEDPQLFLIKKSEFQINSQSSVMINSDFRNDFEIKRFELDDIIREKYNLICTYEPCTHPAVIIKYYCNDSHDDKSGKCLCRDLYGNKGFCVGRGDSTEKGGCKSVTILVFQSGKVIITGGRLISQVNLAYNFIKTILQDNRSLIENNKE